MYKYKVGNVVYVNGRYAEDRCVILDYITNHTNKENTYRVYSGVNNTTYYTTENCMFETREEAHENFMHGE